MKMEPLLHKSKSSFWIEIYKKSLREAQKSLNIAIINAKVKRKEYFT